MYCVGRHDVQQVVPCDIENELRRNIQKGPWTEVPSCVQRRVPGGVTGKAAKAEHALLKHEVLQSLNMRYRDNKDLSPTNFWQL